MTVAVIDTGRTRHSDLDGNTVAGYDMISDSTTARDGGGRDSDPADEGDWFTAGECNSQRAANSSWHGTHVAGTIAAAGNSTGGLGVAYGAKVQHVRVLGKCGGSFSDIIDGIVWASGGSVPGAPANQTPAKVLNLSLGGQSTCSQAMQSAIDGAVGRGSAVVVAAGNSNMDASRFTPANCRNVITVAALDRDGNRSIFRQDGSAGSNYGTTVDVAAPGGETWTATGGVNGIYSTLNSGTTTPGSESYAFYQGTSMAAPHVAGIAALVRAKHDLTPAQLETALKENARAIPGTCSEGCGAGLVDATATLDALGGGEPGDTVTITNPGNQTSKVGDTVSLQLKGESTAGGSLTYSATGLPAGLAISTAGLITGKPTTAGTSTVKVTATDSAQNTGTTSFTWTVTSTQGGTVTLQKPMDQWGFRGWAVQPLQITGSSTAGGALTYTAAGLPPGLTISSAGRITGVPTTAGNFTVTVTGTDSGGSKGTTSFLWRIY
ncbi:S8 family serine peptidase [Actinokineospora soli]|uniref:S8 family serine peptidase n=1 Tax=Actinokineospora soli TaxID=1048753 RepID=A0ABW2TSH3_9PSEU